MSKPSFLYETHMHTSPVSKCAAVTPAEQARIYKKRGYTGVIVTDHFVNGYSSGCSRSLPWKEKIAFFMSGYEDVRREGSKLGLDVFPGWEYTIGELDFLTYGLSADFLLAHPEMEALNIEQYSNLVRDNGGYIAQAHPYRDAWWCTQISLPVEPELIDGIEVYNGGMPPEINKKAYKFARRNGLPMQAGSDSHQKGVSFSAGVMLYKRAESIFDIINAIKGNNPELAMPIDILG
ncbi:MAG: PHP domain-containing protein [Oscillospiraceae bacterium]|nr:PHP domain-containing protein [Oscillospiraceae bacterium]